MKTKVLKLLTNKDIIIKIISLSLLTFIIIVIINYFFPLPFEKTCLMYAFCITKTLLMRVCHIAIFYESNKYTYITKLNYMHVYFPIILILSCYDYFYIFCMVKCLIVWIVILDFSDIIKHMIELIKLNMRIFCMLDPIDLPINMKDTYESPYTMYTYGVASLNSNDPQVRLDPNDATTAVNKTYQKWGLLNNSYNQLVQNIETNATTRREAIAYFETSISLIESRAVLRFVHLASIKWVGSQVNFTPNTRQLLHGLSNGNPMGHNNGLRLAWLNNGNDRTQILEEFKQAKELLLRQEHSIAKVLN